MGAPASPADFGGQAPRGAGVASSRTAAAGPRTGAGSGWDGSAAWDAGARWTDERLAADRARVLRRLGRWSDAAEAWQTAAAAGGGLGVIAWIEVAKLREHRLADPAAPWRRPGRPGDSWNGSHDGPAAPTARGGPPPPRRRLAARLRRRASRASGRIVA